MYCKKCGKELKDTYLFCTRCGNKIERLNQQCKINSNDKKEYSNYQNVNKNQKVKIEFTSSAIGYIGMIGINIDGNKIGKINNKREIETYVTAEQHKMVLDNFRLVKADYILNITPEIKTIYLYLGYDRNNYPKVKNVKIEKINLQQSCIIEDDGTVVKQIKAITILSYLSLIISILGFNLQQIPLGILAIILGSIGYRKEGYNRFARIAALGGIIYGICAIIYTLLQMQINFYNSKIL